MHSQLASQLLLLCTIWQTVEPPGQEQEPRWAIPRDLGCGALTVNIRRQTKPSSREDHSPEKCSRVSGSAAPSAVWAWEGAPTCKVSFPAFGTTKTIQDCLAIRLPFVIRHGMRPLERVRFISSGSEMCNQCGVGVKPKLDGRQKLLAHQRAASLGGRRPYKHLRARCDTANTCQSTLK